MVAIKRSLDPREVLHYVAGKAISPGGQTRLGTFSASIYDAAWLAMVYRDTNRSNHSMFPQCFDHIVATQQDNGTWATSGSSVDGIINSLASLLALSTRARRIPTDRRKYDLDRRIQLGEDGTRKLLSSWNLSSTTNVGFEIIVPSLIRQLREFDINFTLDADDGFQTLFEQKMKRFSVDLIYSNRQTSILHSVEALVGIIDFDKISHHCSRECGLLGSPSATAAYLSQASTWDSNAEVYLWDVLQQYGNTGQVPSAFPTTVFEASWALSTILLTSPNMQSEVKDDHLIRPIAKLLVETTHSQGGLLGFTPGVLADADDTARTLIALGRSGLDIDPRPMIDAFDVANHFKTYDLERNPSFTTNCNVLISLLAVGSPRKCAPQIDKVLQFLLSAWESDRISDKWNSSSEYAVMLLTEGLYSLLRRHQEGYQWLVQQSSQLDRIVSIVCQICQLVLDNQFPDGDSGGSTEITAYNAITLHLLLRIPWSASIRQIIEAALHQAQASIQTRFAALEDDRPLWIEKTTFRVETLSLAYCSAAAVAPATIDEWSSEIETKFHLPPATVDQTRALLVRLPLFQNVSLEKLELVMLRSAYYVDLLKTHSHDLVPNGEMDLVPGKYLNYIPLIWLSCDSIGSERLNSNILRDMMKLSLSIYQVDEVMETIVSNSHRDDQQKLLSSLRHYCKVDGDGIIANGLDASPEQQAPNGNSSSTAEENSEDRHSPLQHTLTVLQAFADSVLHHAAVRKSLHSTQRLISINLYNFLKAHIDHNNDSALYSRSKHPFVLPDPSRGGDYFGWVTSTAAIDTSCPFALRFFSCLLSQPCFQGPEALYHSRSVAHHLAIMCRMYNDCGSDQRDLHEGNLNSLNFSEFECPVSELREGAKKASLMAIAEAERKMMNLALECLSKTVDCKTMAAIETFVQVTDLFGQIYLQKDLSSRKQG